MSWIVRFGWLPECPDSLVWTARVHLPFRMRVLCMFFSLLICLFFYLICFVSFFVHLGPHVNKEKSLANISTAGSNKLGQLLHCSLNFFQSATPWQHTRNPLVPRVGAAPMDKELYIAGLIAMSHYYLLVHCRLMLSLLVFNLQAAKRVWPSPFLSQSPRYPNAS